MRDPAQVSQLLLAGIVAIVQEGIPWALVDPTRVIERSAEIKP